MEIKMDKDRVDGLMDKAKGKVQSAVGDLTGDRKMQAEGAMNQVKGEAKNIAGGIKDKMRENDDDCGCGSKH